MVRFSAGGFAGVAVVDVGYVTTVGLPPGPSVPAGAQRPQWVSRSGDDAVIDFGQWVVPDDVPPPLLIRTTAGDYASAPLGIEFVTDAPSPDVDGFVPGQDVATTVTGLGPVAGVVPEPAGLGVCAVLVAVGRRVRAGAKGRGECRSNG